MVKCRFAISSTDANSPIKRTFKELADVSILPPGTFRLRAANADTTSIIVAPRAAINSGFISTRIARCSPPNTDTLATPLVAVILFANMLSTYSCKSRGDAPRKTISNTDSCNGFNFSTTGCFNASGNSDDSASIFDLTSLDLSLTFTPRLNSAIT